MRTNSKVTSRIRLIFYLPGLVPGGTERVVLNLCRNVSQQRFDIAVCSMTDGLFGDEIRSLGIPVTILSPPGKRSNAASKIFNYWRMLRTLLAMIGQGSPTVVHSHHYGPLLQLSLLRRFTSCRFGWIHTEHSLTDVRNAYAKRWYRVLNPLKFPDVACGVAADVTSYMRHVSGISTELATTVLNGIETDKFCGIDRKAKRSTLGFSTEHLIVGTIGMLRTEKNQQLAIRAFALLASEVSSLHLVVCGDGECRVSLVSLARELGVSDRVHFLGFRLDAHEIMAAFDIYCLPSIYEGLPLSVLEAWAARTPVVATDVIGTREIVRHGENGLLVQLDDERAMADALLKLIQAPGLGRTYADNGYQDVMAGYHIGKMVDRYEQFYQSSAC